MKNKILILIVLAINTNSCIAQKTIIQNNKIMIPKIDNKFEKFDIETFKKEVDSISGKRIVISKGKYLEEDYQNPGYSRVEYDANFFIYKMKLFYDNSFIQQKGLLFNNGSQIGLWYKFDEKGNLTEEINTDEGYDFGWEQVIKYCEDNKIALTKGYDDSGFHTSIYKQEENGKKVWVITYQLPVGDKLMEITLDGKTGKEIKRKELDFIGG